MFRVTLPDLRQVVHTLRRLGAPPTSARTRWMFGSQRREVRTCECDTLLPNQGRFPQTSQTAAMLISCKFVARKRARQPDENTVFDGQPPNDLARRARAIGHTPHRERRGAVLLRGTLPTG